jgi:hypothetical protein
MSENFGRERETERRAVEQQDSRAGEIYAISVVTGLKASLGPDCSIRPTVQTISKESICEYGSKEQIDNEYVQRRIWNSH